MAEGDLKLYIWLGDYGEVFVALAVGENHARTLIVDDLKSHNKDNTLYDSEKLVLSEKPWKVAEGSFAFTHACTYPDG